jgi:hypothetical protein
MGTLFGPATPTTRHRGCSIGAGLCRTWSSGTRHEIAGPPTRPKGRPLAGRGDSSPRAGIGHDGRSPTPRWLGWSGTGGRGCEVSSNRASARRHDVTQGRGAGCPNRVGRRFQEPEAALRRGGAPSTAAAGCATVDRLSAHRDGEPAGDRGAVGEGARGARPCIAARLTW